MADLTNFGKFTYYLLLLMFAGLAILGFYNFYYGRKIQRLNSISLIVFYISSLSVVMLRIALFSSVFIEYDGNFYGICLLLMPNYLNMLAGLSIVMCNFELAIQFKNYEI